MHDGSHLQCFDLAKSHEKNVISINITMVTAHFLVKLGEIKTLHHGV